MNFGEAIQAMKDGKRVLRTDWENKWLAINNLKYGYPFVYCCQDNPVWYPNQEDMLAEDWEVKTETQKVNNDMNGLLYLSLLMFFFALNNLHKEQDNDCHFNS